MPKAESLAQWHVPSGLSISKDGDSITSLCQYSTTFVCTEEAFSQRNFTFSSLCSVPLVLSLSITEKRLVPSLQPSLRYLCTLKSSLLQAEQCHISQCIPVHQMLEFLKLLQGSSLDTLFSATSITLVLEPWAGHSPPDMSHVPQRNLPLPWASRRGTFR